MSHSLWVLSSASRLFSITVIAFIIHKLLKLACGPRFSKPPGPSQLRLLCVRLARGPPVALSQDQTLSKGPLSLEMKTQGSQL